MEKINIMNKGERNRLRNKYYKRRLKKYGIKGDMFCLKDQGKPCSCPVCSPEKYDRNIKHKNKIVELDEDIEIKKEENEDNIKL